MKIFIKLFITFFWIGMTTAYAASPAMDLSALLNGIQNMQADFVQTLFDNHGKVIQTANGHMALKRPGKFRWEVKKPIPQLIIANDSRLWIYDPDLEQVVIRHLQKTTGETPALLLSHATIALEKDYTVKVLSKNMPGWRWFELRPRQANSMFASIEMGFTHKEIKQMRLYDHLGHTTEVQFTHAQTNNSLPMTLFVFNTPANVDVINETSKS